MLEKETIAQEITSILNLPNNPVNLSKGLAHVKFLDALHDHIRTFEYMVQRFSLKSYRGVRHVGEQ
jgi:hypothetical protein